MNGTFRLNQVSVFADVIHTKKQSILLNHWIFRMFYCQLWKKEKISLNHIEMKSLMKKWF